MENKQLNIPNTMVQKHFYEAPESELLLVKFEGNILSEVTQSSTFGDEKPYMNDRSNENWW